MRAVLVDTSGLYEYLNRGAANHLTAKAAMKSLREAGLEPVLTNFLVAEIYALILIRVGATMARSWLLANRWRVERANSADEERATAILMAHSDKDYSYTDAVSFAVMERLGISTALSFDRHFVQYGFQVIGPS